MRHTRAARTHLVVTGAVLLATQVAAAEERGPAAPRVAPGIAQVLERARAGKAPMVDICNYMAMITNGTYSTAAGSAIAGGGVFGGIRDVEVADDCIFGTTYEVTQVCFGTVQVGGTVPADGLWLHVYTDVGGAPAHHASHDVFIPTAGLFIGPYTDTVLGLQGRIYCADIPPGLILGPGNWWFSFQIVDTSPGGDWYALVRDLGRPIGTDAQGRDGGRAELSAPSAHGTAFGGPYPGLYGTGEWRTMANLGFGWGDMAMSIASGWVSARDGAREPGTAD